jgi:hypothetical protein
MGRKKKWKSPVRRRRGQKIPVRVFSARETFGSPAQGGLKNERGAHHSGRAIETAHDDSPKNENRLPAAKLRASCRNRLRDRVERSWPSPPRGDHQLNTTRPNGFCLCAISQLGSKMSCRSWNYSDSTFNLRFDANAWSGIAVAVHLIRRRYKGATPQLSGLSPQFIKLS